ncbi:MAG: prephenate dehydrogenase/arogenate dehydrogenase family protein, partial [Christensenella sp.]
MNIGIVGLGLIGGSLARAIKKYTSHTVYGTDTDPTVLRAATNACAIDCEADISMCDIVFVCLYPRDCVSYMLHTNFKTNAIVADCAGIKQFIANKVSAPLYARGIRYVGTHPMAGKETGGFSSSDAELFQ